MMRSHKPVRRLWAIISPLVLAVVFGLFPTAVSAAVPKTPPPEEPYEKVIYEKGSWSSEYVRYDNKPNLIVSYQGNRDIEQAQTVPNSPAPKDSGQKALVNFKLKEKILLKGVCLPSTYPAVNPQMKIMSFYLKDANGNAYGPFQTMPVSYMKQLSSTDGKAAGDVSAGPVYMDNVFNADSEIILPSGNYSLYTNDDTRLVRNSSTGFEGAALIKGINYSAWKSYKEKLLNWEKANSQEQIPDQKAAKQADDKILISVVGNEALSQARENPEKYRATLPKPSARKLPATISLKTPTLIDEIVFNTYNGGKGAQPGFISITDPKGEIKGKYQAYGGMLGSVPNGLWIAGPGIVLPAGEYTLACSDMSVISYDAKGAPDFYVTTAPMLPQPFDFTGRYRVNVDTIKTSTLMGPVSNGKSSFSLKDFELSVLDNGETIELIGKYEGMPFSQIGKVTERQENSLKANFSFALDLQNLPYKAKVGANALITLQKPPGLQAKIDIQGQATYQRAASKNKGADYNTYKIVGSGAMYGRDLPAYVMAALGAKLASVGNIPGPDSPLQAAAGALFPPLAGLVAHVLQNLLKPKPEAEKPKLSVGEQAMADANQSLGKGLYDEKEAEAWSKLAEALGNSDEPDDDPYSIGDNEKPGGDDYIQPASDRNDGDSGSEYSGETDQEASEESYDEEISEQDSVQESPAGDGYPEEKVFGTEREKLEAERDEWFKNLQTSMESADSNDPRSQELHQQYKDYIDYLDGKISDLAAAEKYAKAPKMTVQTDSTGRTTEIYYDSDSDTWRNSETDNEFNMTIYQNDIDFADQKKFNDAEFHKMEIRDTAFDRAMDALVADNKQRANLLSQLQKIRNEAYGITPPAEGVGDVPNNIDKLIKDLSDRNLPTSDLRDKAVRIAKVVTGRTTGRTISEEAAQRLSDQELSYTHVAAQTVTEGWKDVITGRTWAGMAGRMALAGATGGASEYVLSPAEALADIKESMDSGESGTRATLKAMGKYVLGELGGEYLGEAWKRSGYSINPDLIKKVSDLGNTPVSQVYGKYLSTGAEAGSKEMFSGVSSSASKSALGTADSSVGRNAPDFSEYAKYQTDVKNQASMIENKIRSAAPNRPLTPEDVTKALSPDDIRQVLRDPSVSRELKNMPPKLQDAYQDALEKSLYKPANSNTAKQLETDLLSDIRKEFGPEAQVKVEIDSIRTPGAKGSRINADNDLTGKITITDGQGRKITREIPADKVAPIYNEKFAEASGMIKDGKFDVAKAQLEMPEGITIIDAKGKTRTIDWDQATKEQQLEAFTKKHNQEVTDVHSAEAAVDFNAAKNADGVSNVGKLKAGDLSAALADPGGLAKMEQYKINNYFNKGGIANQTEAYEQLAKMGKLTKDLTGAYQKLGYEAQSLSDNMQKALDIVSNRKLSPVARTVELQKIGFEGPGDLANKLSGRIEGLQKLGQPKPGKSGNPMLKNISSMLIGAYLNDDNK